MSAEEALIRQNVKFSLSFQIGSARVPCKHVACARGGGAAKEEALKARASTRLERGGGGGWGG